MGRAAVCWSCGYVGMPRNPDDGEKSATKDAPLAVCGGCGDDEQTNWARGSPVPLLPPQPVQDVTRRATRAY